MDFSDYPKPPFKYRREGELPLSLNLVLFSGSMLILLAVLYPVFTPPYHGSTRTSCLSNIRQMGTGIRMYAQDYDDELPRSACWMDEIHPYLKNMQVYRCTKLPKEDKRLFGYAFHKQLSGKALIKLISPTETILLYDSSNTAWNASDALISLPDPPRHSGGNNFGYADGHAHWVKSPATSHSIESP